MQPGRVELWARWCRRCRRSGLAREAWQPAQRWSVAARQADPGRPRRRLGATGVSYGKRDIEARPASGGLQRGGRVSGGATLRSDWLIGSTSRSATPATARARQRRRPGRDGGMLRGEWERGRRCSTLRAGVRARPAAQRDQQRRRPGRDGGALAVGRRAPVARRSLWDQAVPSAEMIDPPPSRRGPSSEASQRQSPPVPTQAPAGAPAPAALAS